MISVSLSNPRTHTGERAPPEIHHLGLGRDTLGQRIITCSQDSSTPLWNLENGLQIGKHWQDGNSPVNAIASSPDRKTVVCASDDGAVRLWDSEHGQDTAAKCGHSAGVEIANEWRVDGTIRVWDVESGEIILEPINTGDTRSTVFALVYSPDESKIATVGDEKLIKILHPRWSQLSKGTHMMCDAWPGPWMERHLLVSPDQTMTASGDGIHTWKQFAVLKRHRNAI